MAGATMERNLFDEEHNLFREAFAKFVQKEIVPFHEQWEHDGIVSREVWARAGAQGFLCMDLPEKFGGAGLRDFRYNAIVNEELAKVNATGPRFTLHTDVVVPYLSHYASEEQKERWFPDIVKGTCITAVAMTEPGTGSDLGGLRTTAVREGDHYRINGQKTFITNGILNDLVVVAAKTDPTAKHKGISLIVVERGMEGYERGRNLEKIGMKAQDTAELFFNDVRVPVANLLGEEGKGFRYLMEMLPQERLSSSVNSVAAAEAALGWTVQYARERKAFGQPIGTFQNSRFKLAEMQTEVQIARVFVDRCIMELNAGRLSVADAAMAKWWCSEMQQRVIDQGVQLHGGYGYMTEYPIAKAYQDARVRRIFAGTTEIMKEIIGRAMGF
ncbi:MAG: acyl-CoA dehydrogenase family protein [Candidatus Lambdaproteobacteria bacterium]|nr:acyl-CoA dehydrogenase family protein [Candidatus Lambdaproteobacteria bacterium]